MASLAIGTALVELLELDPGPAAAHEELAAWLVQSRRLLVSAGAYPAFAHDPAEVDRALEERYKTCPVEMLRYLRSGVACYARGALVKVIGLVELDVLEQVTDALEHEARPWLERAWAALERHHPAPRVLARAVA